MEKHREDLSAWCNFEPLFPCIKSNISEFSHINVLLYVKNCRHWYAQNFETENYSEYLQIGPMPIFKTEIFNEVCFKVRSHCGKQKITIDYCSYLT